MPVSKVSYAGNVLIDLTEDTVTPETLAEGVTAHDKTGAVIVGTMVGGVTLPELTNPGTAEDLYVGTEMLDGNGNVVEGTLKPFYGGFTGYVTPAAADGGNPFVRLQCTVETRRVIDPAVGGFIRLDAPFEDFGDATAEDVVAGKTFTSAAGFLVVGTGGNEPDPRDLYQRVEYIEPAEESTYPYIITDFYADNDAGVEVIAAFPSLVDRIPMGSREDSGATRFYCVYPLSANSIYYGFNTGSSISCKLSVDTIYRLQTNFLNSRQVNVYDEDGIRKGGGSISATLTPHTAPVSIFGYYSAASATVSSRREFKLYSARCSRGHEVVREYIPCYRKSDGVIGVYEKFTGQFLTNDDSEGSAFAKGPDIDW